MKNYYMYINGNFVDSNNHIDIENPYTQETFATVPDASTENLESCLKQAKQDQAEWEDTALVERKTLLLEISEIISSNLKKLAEIESTEIGKPIKETLLVDIPIASKVFEYYASILDSFNFSYSFSNSDMNMIHYKPFGIAGILLPYNVPLPLTISQVGEQDISLTAHYRSDPFEIPIYWNWRISYWDDNHAFEIEATHHKIFLKNTTPEIQEFSISHGFNTITFNYAWKDYGFVFRAGFGLVLDDIA